MERNYFKPRLIYDASGLECNSRLHRDACRRSLSEGLINFNELLLISISFSDSRLSKPFRIGFRIILVVKHQLNDNPIKIDAVSWSGFDPSQ